MVTTPFDTPCNEKSTKHIKKEITKLKHQIENLEDSKRDAIEITKKCLMKRDNKQKPNKTKSQITLTDSQTIQRTPTSETNSKIESAKQEEVIKTLKETNKTLYENLIQQEEKNNQLTQSLQSSQLQLKENRKCFEKYENILQENMLLSIKINEFQESLTKKDETNQRILQAAEELARDLQERDDMNKQLHDTVDKLQKNISEIGNMNNKLLETNSELSKGLREKELRYVAIKTKYEAVENKIEIFKAQMQKSQLVNIFFCFFLLQG